MRTSILIAILLLLPQFLFSQRSIETLQDEKLYKFHGDNAFFPSQLKYTYNEGPNYEYFNPGYYSSILKRLSEVSLSTKYLGNEIIRLTAICPYSGKHFIIRITNYQDSISLVFKESVLDYRRVEIKNRKHFNSIELEFDSTLNKYHLVKYKNKLIARSPIIKRRISQVEVDPVARSRYQSLSMVQWNDLIDLMSSLSFCEMNTMGRWGVDGHQVIVEMHSVSGYHVVDRNVPIGSYKIITDSIIKLFGEEIDF